jgi:hypothetical protein
MSECHYCDDVTTSETVCKTCFDKMIYQTDAIKKYGLIKSQLCDLFSVKFIITYYKNNTMCTKYSENDLYKLQDKLIKTMTKTDKQYNKLIKCRNKINDDNKCKENYLKKKIDIENLLIDLFKKNDDQYIKLYSEQISDLVSEYSKTDSGYTDIAYKICEIIEKKIIDNKKINDEQIKKNNNKIKLKNIIKNNEQYLKYDQDIRNFNCCREYINGKIPLKTCIAEFDKFVKFNETRDERLIETNKIIESTFLKTYVTIIKKTDEYTNFINSGDIVDIDDFILKMNEIVSELKERNKQIRIINKKLTEKKLIINKSMEKNNLIINNDNTQDVYNKYLNDSISFDDAIDFIEKSNLIDTIKKAINEYINKYNYACNPINFTFEYFDKYVINANTITKIMKKHIINKKTGQNKFYLFKLQNPISGAGKIQKRIKDEIDKKLFDYHNNDDDVPIILEFDNTIKFFVVERCDQLKLKYEKINKSSFKITKINNPIKCDILLSDVLAEVKNIIKKYIE